MGSPSPPASGGAGVAGAMTALVGLRGECRLPALYSAGRQQQHVSASTWGQSAANSVVQHSRSFLRASGSSVKATVLPERSALSHSHRLGFSLTSKLTGSVRTTVAMSDAIITAQHPHQAAPSLPGAPAFSQCRAHAPRIDLCSKRHCHLLRAGPSPQRKRLSVSRTLGTVTRGQRAMPTCWAAVSCCGHHAGAGSCPGPHRITGLVSLPC